MFKHLDHPRLFVLITVLTLFALAGPSLGQSDRDLRVENQRLNAQVKQLGRELNAAQSRIEKLEKQVKDLEKALKSARNAPKKPKQQPKVDEKVSIDESVATASPRALSNAIKADYEKALAGIDQGQPGDRTHKNYLKAVQRWTIAANREYREKIQWHVRILGVRPTQKGFAVELQAVDPKTNTKLGNPFFALLSKGLAKRYDQIIRRSGVEVVELKGTLHPNVTFDRTRPTAGQFNNTKFIGPYAQFEFAVDATSLQPPSEDEEKDKSDS